MTFMLGGDHADSRSTKSKNKGVPKAPAWLPHHHVDTVRPLGVLSYQKAYLLGRAVIVSGLKFTRPKTFNFDLINHHSASF